MRKGRSIRGSGVYCSKSQESGWMSLKEHMVFNMALLSKTTWRIQNEATAFGVKISKGIYFHESKFLENSKGPRAALVWSNINQGKHVLKNGGIKKTLDAELIQL